MSHLLKITKLKSPVIYSYHFVNVRTLGLAQSDHIKRPLLFFQCYTKIKVRKIQMIAYRIVKKKHLLVIWDYF